MRNTRALVFAVISCAFLASSAAAVAPEIKDDAKFFSAETVKKANEQIKDIARKHGFDLLVETFDTVPGDQAAKVKALEPDERTKFFQNWAKDRINHHVVNGVYVLICRQPPHIRVEVTDKATARFGSAFGPELGKVLVGEFSKKQFDDGLLKAVKQLQDKLAGGAKSKKK